MQPRGATLFVTFRLAGSLPQSVVERLTAARQAELRIATTNEDRYLAERRHFGRFDEELHLSNGPDYLQQPTLAQIVADSLHYRDQRVYRLDAFTILSNHTHVVFAPLQMDVNSDGTPRYHKLSKIMQSLKRHTATECNRMLGLQGIFWQAESYVHIVRDGAEWERIIRYVLNNPVKAGLVSEWWEWPYTYLRSD